MSYVYIRSEPRLWTVGFYEPDGTWHPESDQGSFEEAAGRVAWLNGGGDPALAGKLTDLADWIDQRLDDDEYDQAMVAEYSVTQLRELAALARAGGAR